MTALLVFAAVLLLAVLVSELAHRSVLSTAVLFLMAGFAVGEGALGLVPIKANDPLEIRLAELALPAVPVLVVQGERDPFGRPPPAPGREVVLLAGDHALRADLSGVAAAVTAWLTRLLPPAGPGP